MSVSRNGTVFVLVITVVSAFAAVSMRAHAEGFLSYISDLISTSVPSASATHRIQFTLDNAIPPSGSIVITPEDGYFAIPTDFDYTDVDFAFSTTGPSGYYQDRAVAATANAVNDGITVVTGSSSSITITLNSTDGLNAGDAIQIRLGTNAVFGVTGDYNIPNPFDLRSYLIGVVTRDASSVPIDEGETLVVVVQPVSLTVNMPIIEPVRSNGLPSGLIAAGNTIIELSLETDILATCRYATSTGVLYDDMIVQFNPTYGTLFYVNTTGYENDTTYTFYVRCRAAGGGTNNDDYPISFTLKPTPSSDTSIEYEGYVTSGPTGNLGRGGTGDFPNGSNVLYYANVTFSGTTIPGGLVTVLKDGVKVGSITARSDGTFTLTLSAIERGAYGFQLYTQDSRGLVSAMYGTTLSLMQGTNNQITNILIPPTIKLSAENVGIGEAVTISGGAPPLTQVHVAIAGPDASSPESTYIATSSSNGNWSFDINTGSFAKGEYLAQAFVVRSDLSKSGLSKLVTLSVGGATSAGSCGTSDMNGDGKVNLVDFSIFLLHWNTDDSVADFNCDKAVNLGDFSIMLFNWTG
jgi:hypothetical protein